jgi:glycosyltransferase involved in cell wall biosynthesis
MKIALVHDQLNEFGGAERVLLAMSEIWPEAPIYTAYCKKGSPAWERFKNKNIKTSWMQSINPLASPLRFLAPAVWNSFDLSRYDVIIGSSSWYITKGFKKKGKAIEICYCHTPPRWLSGYPTSVNWQRYAIVRAYATIVGFFMRQYDYEAAQRVDYFIANSQETQRRIQKFYRRDSAVMYPPVDLPSAPQVKKEQYYLFVSRPVGSKGLELARAASQKMGFPLKVVGAVGDHVSDTELAKLYAGAKAFLALATDEDFGMTPVEAMSMGTPVIAYAGGGYRESVIDGKTGVLFTEPTVESLIAALKKFETLKIDAKDCIIQAKKFSKERFQKELKSFVKAHV